MKSAKRIQKKATNVLACFLILCLLAGIIGALARFTGGFTQGFQTLFLCVNGEDIYTSAGGFECSPQSPLTVEVKDGLRPLEESPPEYTVRIVPNQIAGKDFDFYLNGQAYSFQSEQNLTAGFKLSYEENGFTLAPKGGTADILRGVYPNSEIECSGKGYADMFTLIVSSPQETQRVSVHFFAYADIKEIKLDQEVIVF